MNSDVMDMSKKYIFHSVHLLRLVTFEFQHDRQEPYEVKEVFP